jgi:hypothetical protein
MWPNTHNILSRCEFRGIKAVLSGANTRRFSTLPSQIRLGYYPQAKAYPSVIQSEGQDSFVSAGRANKSLKFKIHVDIGGITGVIAPMIGEEPPDTHVWVSGGVVPAFIRSEEPLYFGGPVLRTELVSPVWPATPKSEREDQGR